MLYCDCHFTIPQYPTAIQLYCRLLTFPIFIIFFVLGNLDMRSTYHQNINILASTSFYNYVSFHLRCSSRIQYGNILKVVITFKRYEYLYLKTKINRYQFDTLKCFPYFTCCPFIPTCCNITSILIDTSRMVADIKLCRRRNEK